MVTKDRAIKMIERAKEKVDKCDVIAVTLMNQTSEFLEDSYNDRGIDMYTFNELRHRIRAMSNQFSHDCGCTKRIPGEPKLILPLKETPKVESKVISPPKMYSH